jgi:succinate dehydrogenase hydrophobic anchor subunit
MKSFFQSPLTAVILIVFLVMAIYFMLRIVSNLKTMQKPEINKWDVSKM